MDDTKNKPRQRSTIADIRRAQIAAMERGDRKLVITLELMVIHRSLEARGLLINDEQSDSSGPPQS